MLIKQLKDGNIMQIKYSLSNKIRINKNSIIGEPIEIILKLRILPKMWFISFWITKEERENFIVG